MISKELLREVLGEDRATSCNKLEMEIDNSFLVVDDWITINIYELAHKCKEWAVVKQYYNIGIRLDYTGYACIIRQNPMTFLNTELVFRANTEPEAVFRACQWILDKTKES